MSSDVIRLGPHGKRVGHGFLSLWRQLEQADQTLPLRALGWPLTDEFEYEGNVYQVFERVVLKWARAEQHPWDVHVAPLHEAWSVRLVAALRGLMPGGE